MSVAAANPTPSRADLAAAVADYERREHAERLALRLVAEGIGAEVWASKDAAMLLPVTQPPIGPTVVVRRADHGAALVLASLFAEVDEGTSRVAPPPRDFWHGDAHHRLAGYGLVALLALAIVVLVVAAVMIR